jgi:hypothetical protein
LLLLAGLALSFGSGPGHAFTVESCDIVAFAGKTSLVVTAPAPWQVYREAADAAVAMTAPGARLTALIAAQADFIEAVKQSAAYRDHLAGESCRVLSTLSEGAVDALLAEAVAQLPAPSGEALATAIAEAKAQLDRIKQTARFRSAKDLTLFAARYYCFIAATIVAFLPPERRAEISLEDFGDTVSCKDAGRTG